MDDNNLLNIKTTQFGEATLQPQPPKKSKKLIILIGVILTITGIILFFGDKILDHLMPSYPKKDGDFMKSTVNEKEIELTLNNFDKINSDISEIEKLIQWKFDGSYSGWKFIQTIETERLPKPNDIVMLFSKSFNSEDLEYKNDVEIARREHSNVVTLIKNWLADNNWILTAKPREPGFYQDFLYQKDNNSLILSIGTRDAVNGGLYINIQHDATESLGLTPNIFSHENIEIGQKVGAMVVDKIYYPISEAKVGIEFKGTAKLTGTLYIRDLKEEGFGPEYSIRYLTNDSLKQLPYLSSDSRMVWFGIENTENIKKLGFKNLDKVFVEIDIYYYTYMDSQVFNRANVVNIKKAQ